MEIVKELNLNGNPQTVTNGSLVYAKNIKLSVDGTYITGDDGFSICFDNTPYTDSLKYRLKVSNIKGVKEDNIFVEDTTYHDELDNVIRRHYTSEKIVGNINCPNEVIFFVYKEYVNYNESDVEISSGSESIIYRAVEFKDNSLFALFKVPTGWVYNGGTIVGTYTYNVYGHLIIGIAESDANVDKQLLTIDLNDSSNLDSLDKYSCAPNVPIANLTLNNKVKGKAMKHGLYYFFIRYEVSDKLYTNWFPIGSPQYALSIDYKTLIDHIYKGDSITKRTNLSALVNTNKDSYYNFDYVITFNNTYNYIGFQIAYIIQTDNSSEGRIWNNFIFENGVTSKSFVFDGGSIEEVAIDDLIRNVLNVYNVKALTNYNSKLYVANFKETDYNQCNDDLKDCASRIDTFLTRTIVKLDEVEKGSTLMVNWSYKIGDITCTITVPSSTTSIRIKDFPDLARAINQATYWKVSGDYADVYYQLGEDARLEFNENELKLISTKQGPAENGGQMFAYERGYYCIGCYIYTDPLTENQYIAGYGYISDDYVIITKEETVENYKTYNTDNVIRTLMPYEVYAFYVHYVRADGSYTNGIPLENKAPIKKINLYQFNQQSNEYEPIVENGEYVTDYTYYYKRIADLTESQINGIVVDLGQRDFKDIITIDEIKNRFFYELYIKTNAYNKEYFSVYLDDNGKKLFRTSAAIAHLQDEIYFTRLGIKFENIHKPEGYVGVFFSYEKVDTVSVYQGYVSDLLTGNANVIVKSSDAELVLNRYDGALFIPHHKIENGELKSIAAEPFYAYINNAAPILSNNSINFEGSKIDRIGTHGGIAMNMSKSDTETYQPGVGILGSIILLNNSVYSNEVKTLIPFGPVVELQSYSTGVSYGEIPFYPTESGIVSIYDSEVNYNINYPSFLTKDKILLYKDKINIDEEAGVNLIRDNKITDTKYNDNQYVKSDGSDILNIWKFSNFNLLALEINIDPKEIGGVIEESNDNVNTINTIIYPAYATELFKLQSCYIHKIYKQYTNYNKYIKTPSTITNVIRSSYPIRNESGINSWRLFNPTSYHIIDNSNGEIINIFGAGTYFFVHTKNNLLVTSSNSKITADNTTIHLQENNVFDIPPSEVFTSELGYGGIKYQYCQMFSQFGYIWYDTDRRKLFRWDSGKLIDINSGIDEIIKRYNFEYCYINIDNNSNRIFFSFADSNKDKKITLSYDTLNQKWLSIYDFIYDMSIHTANNIMFCLKSDNNVYSYNVNETPCDYKNIQFVNEDIPNYLDSDKYFCFDVIFNNSYTTPKVLNNITWVHDVIKQHILDDKHPAQLKFETAKIINKNEDLKGVNIVIYSDSVDSGLLSLYTDKLNDVNSLNGYKYPYYNKGVWNLNYFRNNIIIPVTDEELETLSIQYGISSDALKDVYKIIDSNGNPVYVDGKQSYQNSDLRSLIYGKYIVVRFIFKTDKRIKFDNLEFNVQTY